MLCLKEERSYFVKFQMFEVFTVLIDSTTSSFFFVEIGTKRPFEDIKEDLMHALNIHDPLSSITQSVNADSFILHSVGK